LPQLVKFSKHAEVLFLYKRGYLVFGQ